MYANILVSTDGSDFAKKGVEQRITLAKALTAEAGSHHRNRTLPFDHGNAAMRHRTEFLAQVTDGYDAEPARNVRAKCSTKSSNGRHIGYPRTLACSE